MAESKKRGRPAGSKNRKTVETMALPATCPTCGSAEVKVIEGRKPIREQRESGFLPGCDFKFSRIVWRACACVCGQRVTVRTYYPD
jgi:hypothetical protein